MRIVLQKAVRVRATAKDFVLQHARLRVVRECPKPLGDRLRLGGELPITQRAPADCERTDSEAVQIDENLIVMCRLRTLVAHCEKLGPLTSQTPDQGRRVRSATLLQRAIDGQTNSQHPGLLRAGRSPLGHPWAALAGPPPPPFPGNKPLATPPP